MSRFHVNYVIYVLVFKRRFKKLRSYCWILDYYRCYLFQYDSIVE